MTRVWERYNHEPAVILTALLQVLVIWVHMMPQVNILPPVVKVNLYSSFVTRICTMSSLHAAFVQVTSPEHVPVPGSQGNDEGIHSCRVSTCSCQHVQLQVIKVHMSTLMPHLPPLAKVCITLMIVHVLLILAPTYVQATSPASVVVPTCSEVSYEGNYKSQVHISYIQYSRIRNVRSFSGTISFDIQPC